MYRYVAYLADIDDVGVVEAEQNVDLADGSEWEAVLLFFHAHLLQRADAVCTLFACPVTNDTARFYPCFPAQTKCADQLTQL